MVTMEKARVIIKNKKGLIQLEGSEEFIDKQLDKFRNIAPGSQTPAPTTSASNLPSQGNGTPTKRCSARISSLYFLILMLPLLVVDRVLSFSPSVIKTYPYIILIFLAFAFLLGFAKHLPGIKRTSVPILNFVSMFFIGVGIIFIVLSVVYFNDISQKLNVFGVGVTVASLGFAFLFALNRRLENKIDDLIKKLPESEKKEDEQPKPGK
jgi:hypothetical protein